MSSATMTHLHQRSGPWTWQLEARQATTLGAAGAPRWLRVDEGCLWVTATRSVDGTQVEDIWLAPGQSLALPSGSAWVLQAWPGARMSLLQAAPNLSRAASSRRGVWGWPLRGAWRLVRQLARQWAWPRALA